MDSINSKLELKYAIIRAEERRDEQKKILKEMIAQFKEELKPAHLIKKAFTELTASPGFKNGIVNSLIALATGYLSKKIVVRKSSGIIRNLLGDLLQSGVTGYVTTHPNGIQSKGMSLLKNILSRVVYSEPKKESN